MLEIPKIVSEIGNLVFRTRFMPFGTFPIFISNYPC